MSESRNEIEPRLPVSRRHGGPLYVFFALLVTAALACALPNPPSTASPGETDIQTRVAATLTALAQVPPTGLPTDTPAPVEPPTEAAPAETATPPPPPVLPKPLYFLASPSGTRQVMRLEVDGVTLAQITNEGAQVGWFDVSPADGRVAYVANNNLVLTDANGENATVLVAGATLPPDPDESYWAQEISSPVWSPDGSRLAYALNGVNIHDLTTGATMTVLSNVLPTEDDPASIRLYRPYLWSPDGSKLLAFVSYYEAGSMVIVPAAGGEALSLSVPDSLVCCQPAWSNDSQSVYVANDSVGLLTPGLWRIDANTGQGVTLIQGDDGSGTLTFAAWPKQAPDGRLLYFFGQTATFPERGTWPLAMVASEADGVTGRANLRSDSYIAADVLWAPDGSLAVITDNSEMSTVYPPIGPVRLLRADGSPAAQLADLGRNLRWGQ